MNFQKKKVHLTVSADGKTLKITVGDKSSKMRPEVSFFPSRFIRSRTGGAETRSQASYVFISFANSDH